MQAQICSDCGKKADLIPYSSASSNVCEQCFDIRQDSLFIPLHKILDNLFLGSLQAIQDDTLEKNDIKAICSCGKGLKQPKNVEKYLYKNIPVGDLDQQNVYDYFQGFYEWVNERITKDKCSVLVHCAAGASRSATFVISYVMKSKNLKYSQALKFVQSIRRCVNPNDGFKRQLQKWQLIIFEEK